MLTFLNTLSYSRAMAKTPQPDRRTLRERTAADIRQMVVDGAIKPGEHVREVPLSKSFGVSRGTLREALRGLEAEGLLVADGSGHLLVTELSSSRVLEIYEVREALEVIAASRVARSTNAAVHVAELRQALAPLRDPDLGFAEQIEADMGFHQKLCQLSGNQSLLESWNRLRGQIEMIIIGAGPIRASGRMRYDDHDAIVSAIESGDNTYAEAAVRAHMRAFCKAYVEDAITRESRARPLWSTAG